MGASSDPFGGFYWEARGPFATEKQHVCDRRRINRDKERAAICHGNVVTLSPAETVERRFHSRLLFRLTLWKVAGRGPRGRLFEGKVVEGSVCGGVCGGGGCAVGGETGEMDWRRGFPRVVRFTLYRYRL